jgi:uncharacterized protein (DUF2252 family)
MSDEGTAQETQQHMRTTRSKRPHKTRAKARKAAPAPVQTEARILMSMAVRGKIDFRAAGESWERRVAFGESLRKTTPLESHFGWRPAKGRPDPVATMLASEAGRQKHLLPLRHGRMAASPFSFLRGAADVMAWDLSNTPNSGLPVIICGDCHVNNFGLYGTPLGDVVLDINDFDEVAVGPWEWDLKRLTASVNVLGRENGLDAKERRLAVMVCVAGYRVNMQRLQSMGVLDLWFLHTAADRPDLAAVERLYPKIAKLWPKAQPILAKAVAKARKTNNTKLLAKVADRSVDGGWRFKEDPPILTPVDAETREKVITALDAYAETVAPERQFMLRRYHVADVAHRVVGVGSVGTHAYLALLFANSDADPLFLQVKEAGIPVHAPYLPPLPPESPGAQHQGRRVLSGEVVLQAAHDPLLGWTEIDGRHYYVRMMKNMKGGIPMGYLSGEAFHFFVFAFGALLARAHARSGDAAVIAGYVGTSAALDKALADWAEAYGEQTLKDHTALVKAIKSGRVEAVSEV